MMNSEFVPHRFFLYFILFLLFLIPEPGAAQDDFVRKMFRDTAGVSLIPDFTDSYGVVFRDLNNDDLPDIYVVRFRNLNRLFINWGPGRSFTDYTIPSGLGGNLMPLGQRNLELGASAADFDNDGRADVLLAGWGVSTRLFRQRKELRFRDVTETAGIKLPLDGNGGFWADANLDGNLDLFITDEHYPNHLFLGNGRGKFRDVSKEWGLPENTVSQGAAWADVDRDGFPDLYVCNWFAEDVFYRNMEGKRLEAQHLPIKHLSEIINSNGVTFGDVDNDGDLDLLVTDRNRESRLYRNDTPADSGEWVFRDISLSAGIDIPYPAYGSIIADFDNDGWQDIWVNCIGPNMLFLNEGGGKFRKAFQEQHTFWHPKKHYSTGAAAADVDRDGDLELFIANKDTHSVLYLNPLNNSNYLKIKLIGVRANRDAIGAKVWLYREGAAPDSARLVGYREISGGGGYLSQNSEVVHFGVESDAQYRAVILFPGGKRKTVTGLSAGGTYVIQEYDGLLRAFYRSYQFLYRATGQPDFRKNLALFLVLILLLIGYTLFAAGRYRWAARQMIIFLSLSVVLLYGLFLALQAFTLQTRLLVQILSLSSFLLFFSILMEKIRRLELKRREYRKLLEHFSREMILIKDNRELYEQLVKTVYRTVRLQFCALYEYRGKILQKKVGEGKEELPVEIPLPDNGLKQIVRDSSPETLRALLPDLAMTHVFPLVRGNTLYGVLVIGPAAGRTPFREEDLAIFNILAAQAAITIENNKYIEETRRLIKQVTEAETREKYVKELEEKNRTLQQLYRDLQEAQTQLIQSEKMASLGQLVAGIAHELNNPISYVYANMRELQNYIAAITQLLKVLKEETEREDFEQRLKQTIAELHQKYDLDFIQQDIQSLIRESIEGSQRVKNVVQNLRNFSRLDEAEFKAVDLHEGLDSTLLLLNNEIKNRITVHKDYGDLPKVHCHPGHINQVFMNLLHNATQAIEGKGNIWITTRRTNGRVMIEIRDDGRGIAREHLNKIFDPFFTTKPVGSGTGLGLSISYNIIKEHGGTIEVESEVGKGTTFRIILPERPKDSRKKKKEE